MTETLMVRVCGAYIRGRPVGSCRLERIPAENTGHPTVRVTHGGATAGAARLVGVVWVCGDPFPTPPPAPIQDDCGLQSGHTEVVDGTGAIVARQRFRDGRFVLTVPPGRYTLVTWNSGNGPWKQRVDVSSDETAHVFVTIRAI